MWTELENGFYTHLDFNSKITTANAIIGIYPGETKKAPDGKGRGKVDVEIIGVPYDFESAAKAIENTAALPNEFADMLRNGHI